MADANRDAFSPTLRHDAGHETGHHRQPPFLPIDVAALVVAVLMVWGPLVAGALRQ